MTTLTANLMADALRMCGNTGSCAGCPHQILGPGPCIRALQNDAAEMIDAQSQLIDEQEAKLEALLKLVKKAFYLETSGARPLGMPPKARGRAGVSQGP